jgi:NDP-sugar pyrophosphorylase family protein
VTGVQTCALPISLGTGGALKHAEPFIRSNPFIALNGDSFCPVPLKRMLAAHRRTKAAATLALACEPRRTDCGRVLLGRGRRIRAFTEKPRAGFRDPVNAGIYVLSRRILDAIPRGRVFSLEHDLFPRLEHCYGFLCEGALTDIGTPARYREARKKL